MAKNFDSAKKIQDGRRTVGRPISSDPLKKDWFYLRESDSEFLQQLADARSLKRSAFYRQIIEEFLEAQK